MKFIRFSINGGRVTYQSRYVKSKAYLRNVKAKKVVVPEFSTAAAPDPCQTIFHRYFDSLLSSAYITTFQIELARYLCSTE